jgi:hypothetical protein
MHVGDKFGDLYRVPSDPVAGLMDGQDLIAIETMLQQCLQSLIVANAAALRMTIAIAPAMRNTSKYVHASYNGYSLRMWAPPNTGSHFTNNAVIFLIVYRIMRDLLVMVAFRHGLRPIGGNNGASLPALLMLGSLHQTNSILEGK